MYGVGFRKTFANSKIYTYLSEIIGKGLHPKNIRKMFILGKCLSIHQNVNFATNNSFDAVNSSPNKNVLLRKATRKISLVSKNPWITSDVLKNQSILKTKHQNKIHQGTSFLHK